MKKIVLTGPCINKEKIKIVLKPNIDDKNIRTDVMEHDAMTVFRLMNDYLPSGTVNGIYKLLHAAKENPPTVWMKK